MSDAEHNPSPAKSKSTPRGLGRGLANLLSSTMTSPEVNKAFKIKLIALDALGPMKQQPRTHFDEKAMQELAASIKEHGVLQPLLVSEIPDTGTYKIIAGERRYKAAQIAGLKEVPAVVRECFSPGVSFELALIENIQRSNLTALEEARAFHILLEEYQLSQEDLAKRIGKERSSIANTLRLLKLHPTTIHALEAESITVGHAKVLCGVDFEQQPRWLKKIEKKQLSVRSLEEMLNQTTQVRQKKEKRQENQVLKYLDPQFELMRKTAEELLSMKIHINPKDKESGEVVFHYHSLQALTELFEIIDVK